MFGSHEKKPIYRSKCSQRLWLALLCMMLLVPIQCVRVQAGTRKSATTSGTGNSYPVIWAVYVGYHTLGDTNRAFPFDSDSVAIRAIIVAWTDSVNKAAYTYLVGAPSDFNDGGQWHIEGAQGMEHAQYVTFGYGANFDYYWFSELSPSYFGTIKPWPAAWGTPTFTWTHPTDACIQKCSSDCGTGAHRRYEFTDESSTLEGWGTNGRYLDWGTTRYRVRVDYLPPGMSSEKTQTNYSKGNDEATRISVLDHRNFGITIPESEPGKSDAERRLRLLQWIHAYARVPYEFGGSWFGGRIQNPFTTCDGGCDDCELYGIDCSHTVCVGTKWAGYSWSGGSQGGYYYNTSGLAGSYCGTDIDDQEDLTDMVPGDIENWSNHHVRTVMSYNSGTDHLVTIAGEPSSSAGSNLNMVKEITVDWSSDRGDGYVIRHLTAH